MRHDYLFDLIDLFALGIGFTTLPDEKDENAVNETIATEFATEEEGGNEIV